MLIYILYTIYCIIYLSKERKKSITPVRKGLQKNDIKGRRVPRPLFSDITFLFMFYEMQTCKVIVAMILEAYVFYVLL